MSDCLFCNIIQKQLPAKIVYEDPHCLAIEDKYPKAPIHLLVLPKKHIVHLNDLDQEDKDLMGHMVLKFSEIAQIAGLNNGFKTLVHTIQGQEIFHLHFHILGTP